MTRLSARNTYHTLYDPKSVQNKQAGKRQYSPDYHSKGLPKAIMRSLQFASKRRETHQGDNQQSQVFMWAKEDDVLKAMQSSVFSRLVQETKTDCENQRQTFKIDEDSIQIHPTEQQSDFKGQAIKDLNGKIVTFNFQAPDKTVKTGNLYAFQSSALGALSQHCLEKGYITSEQYKICDDLIQKTNPDGDAYLYEVGLVNDIKKFLVLFLESKAFKGGERYYDLDKTERQKLIPEDHIIQTLHKASSPEPVGCFMGLDVDHIMMQDGLTDPDNVFSVLRNYHEFLEMLGDDFYYKTLHNPDVSLAEVQKAFSIRLREQKDKCDTGKGLEEIGYTPEEIQNTGHRGTFRPHPECDIDIYKCLILKKNHRGIDVDFLFRRIFQPNNMTSWTPPSTTRYGVNQDKKEQFYLKSIALNADIDGSWFANVDKDDDQKTWK